MKKYSMTIITKTVGKSVAVGWSFPQRSCRGHCMRACGKFHEFSFVTNSG